MLSARQANIRRNLFVSVKPPSRNNAFPSVADIRSSSVGHPRTSFLGPPTRQNLSADIIQLSCFHPTRMRLSVEYHIYSCVGCIRVRYQQYYFMMSDRWESPLRIPLWWPFCCTSRIPYFHPWRLHGNPLRISFRQFSGVRLRGIPVNRISEKFLKDSRDGWHGSYLMSEWVNNRRSKGYPGKMAW